MTPTVLNLSAMRDLAETCLDSIVQSSELTTNEHMLALVEACQVIDDAYVDYCAEFDEDNNDPDGTAYNDGVHCEFTIEASDWHNVSVALRNVQAYLTKQAKQ